MKKFSILVIIIFVVFNLPSSKMIAQSSWILQNIPGQSNILKDMDVFDENTVIAVGDSEIIIKTTDGGISQISQTIGTAAMLNGVSFIDANNGTAVGDEGTILRTTNGGVTFIEEEKFDELPTEFLLSQNYPNPFNPSMKIRYSVRQSSNVIIKVFDILGNENETLVNEEKPAGSYEVNFNVSQLSSGIYFYKLQAGSFIENRKMILMK